MKRDHRNSDGGRSKDAIVSRMPMQRFILLAVSINPWFHSGIVQKKHHVDLRCLPAILALLALCCGDAAPVSRTERLHKEVDRPSILLVTLDTTRQDRIGLYGSDRGLTPNLDAVGRAGVMFLDARIEVPITLPSHASILSGLRLREHGVRENGVYKLEEEVMTLPEALGRRGYTTAAFVSSFVLDERFGLAQGFEFYDDEMTRKGRRRWRGHEVSNFERPADETTDRALRWLAKQHEGPFFIWAHYYDPHQPYEPAVEIDGAHPYDAEVAFMDTHVGRLIAASRAADSDLLIIIASDHGENLGEKGREGHGRDLWETVMRGVLLMQHPRLLPRATRVPHRVLLADILATTLDLADIEANPPGRSLLGLLDAGQVTEDLPVYMETIMPAERFGQSEVKGLLEGEMKLHWWPGDDRVALFDLSSDPHEQDDLAMKRAETAEAMLERLKALDDAFERRASGVELDDETRSKLRALGYLGGE